MEKGLKGIIMVNIYPIFIQLYMNIYVRMRAFKANVHLVVGSPLNFNTHLKMGCTLINDRHKCRPGKPAGWEGGGGKIRTTVTMITFFFQKTMEASVDQLANSKYYRPGAKELERKVKNNCNRTPNFSKHDNEWGLLYSKQIISHRNG